MSGPTRLGVEIFVAVIEWSDDSVDPALFADIDEDRLHANIRTRIEDAATDLYPDEWEEFVIGSTGDGTYYHEWYEVLHDIGDSPWVTIQTKEI